MDNMGNLVNYCKHHLLKFALLNDLNDKKDSNLIFPRRKRIL